MTLAMAWTGERMIPEGSDGTTFWEHVYRYRFASDLVRDKRVLDIACGEGYGAAALARSGAASVIGVDVEQAVCDHAHRKYGIDARMGDALAIPLADNSVDIVTSFETVEHVADPQRFIRECSRVLTSRGTLVISTPNRDVYSENGHHNRFHCSEMNRREFVDSLTRCFSTVRLFSQRVRTAPFWTTRSLGALNSPWLNVKGFYWLRRKLLPGAVANGWDAETTERERYDIVTTILKRDSLLSNVLNPFAVRPATGHGNEAATYFIAVAVK